MRTSVLSSVLLAAVGAFSMLPACAPGGSPPDDGGPNDWPDDPCARALDGVAAGVELYRFEGGEPYVSVHVEREYEGGGVGESSLYGLRSFALGADDDCLESREEAALSDENSHHNWADRARAVIDGVVYTVAMDFAFGDEGAGWRVSVSGVDEGSDEVVLEREGLVATAGPLACWACPGAQPVWITEVLPENDGETRDEAGDADPWLELWNPSSDAVDLTGWTLELSGADTGRFTFPEGTSIARHGHLIVWLDGEPSEGELHTPFALPREGGRIALVAPDGSGVGERTFSSPGLGKSLDLDLAERAFVVSDAPTPGQTSPGQQ